MQIETAILAPAAVLAGWTMVVFLWLIARRMPAFAAAGINANGGAGYVPAADAQRVGRRFARVCVGQRAPVFELLLQKLQKALA